MGRFSNKDYKKWQNSILEYGTNNNDPSITPNLAERFSLYLNMSWSEARFGYPPLTNVGSGDIDFPSQNTGGGNSCLSRENAITAGNIQDAQEHGAGTMVFLCPVCLDALYKPCRDAGMETYMISDLCRLTIGETLPAEAYQNLG